MILHIQYRDFRYDYVDTRTLDRLLEDEGLRRFYRPSEQRWVNVFRDPIRGLGGTYEGVDRRNTTRPHRFKKPVTYEVQGHLVEF
jgi:hypothetical protein